MTTALQVLKSDFFRALAHPTRIRMLELLAQRERSVQELQGALALEQPIVSQHLAALRARHVVTVRREGTQAHYALRSPLVADLLRVAREFLNQHLSESQPGVIDAARTEARGSERVTTMDKAWTPWLPKSILALRTTTGSRSGTISSPGVTVGLVALPLAMAFAISSGLPPQAGIYCAIVAGFLISALGGSRVQIGGPTGAFVVVVVRHRRQHGVDGLFMCTMMAGVMLVVLGVTGTGHRGAVHPAAGRHRVHERHRRPHREHADQGLLRAPAGESARRVPGRAWRRSAGTARTLSPPAPRSALGLALADRARLRTGS